jgi:LacI family transcriptional regulator
MPSERGRATITDVARLSGTSIKTVSRVFNDEPFVRAATRQRVLSAASELEYHPNVAARSLVRGRSSMIGLFYENPSPNYVVDLQTGSLDRLHGERFRLLLFPCESAAQVAGRLPGIARSAGLEGMIIAPPIGDDPATITALLKAGIPFVRIAPTHAPEVSPAVRIDDAAAARDMTRHLIALGHRRIALIRGEPTHPSSAERFQGYRDALAEAGLEIDPSLIDEGHYTFESGLAAGRRLLATRSRPSAIFAANDDMAAGVLVAAQEHGLSIPGQLSIAGFDDSLISRVVWPQLTTIRQPTYEMARCATDALLAAIRDGGGGTMRQLDYELLVRGSTGPHHFRTHADEHQPIDSRTGWGKLDIDSAECRPKN